MNLDRFIMSENGLVHLKSRHLFQKKFILYKIAKNLQESLIATDSPNNAPLVKIVHSSPLHLVFRTSLRSFIGIFLIPPTGKNQDNLLTYEIMKASTFIHLV